MVKPRNAKEKDDAASHSFDPAIARRVGVPAAVVFRNLVFWIRHNEANNKNFHDGRYWTYNSYKAFGEQFSYLTEKQVRTALDKLVDAGLIVKGKHHRDRFNRENWYTLGDTVCPNGHIGKPKEENDGSARLGSRSDPEGKSIENRYKPDSNPYPYSDGHVRLAETEVEAIWKAYPEDRRRDRSAFVQLVEEAACHATLPELLAAVEAYARESATFERTKVSFIDNWFRRAKWRRHVDDLRRQRVSEHRKNSNPHRPATSLRVIPASAEEEIEAWDQQLELWNLPPLHQLADSGEEGGRTGWLWPLRYVPSEPDSLKRIEHHARWLFEGHRVKPLERRERRHAG